MEWPTGEREPTKYWLSNVPETVTLEDLVRLVKIRWRIERDYQVRVSVIVITRFAIVISCFGIVITAAPR